MRDADVESALPANTFLSNLDKLVTLNSNFEGQSAVGGSSQMS